MTLHIVHQAPSPPLSQQFTVLQAGSNHWIADMSPGTVDWIKQQHAVDINPLPADLNPSTIKLVISDMDSTLISIECIDEMAHYAQRPSLGHRIAEITEQAMQGHMNFYESLEARLALLEGIPISVLEEVYTSRLTLNPGARRLLKHLADHHIPFALVSGGFTFFTERLQAKLPINYALANQLEICHGRLTGKLIGKLIGPLEKRLFLEQLCHQLNIHPKQTIAIGDGANDLEMMEIAGLSVAFKAKPLVQKKCDWQLNLSGLDALMALW